MTTYYVSKSGSNSGSGSSSSPWLTISKAMQSGLHAGDTVIVRSGTYNEQVRISASGNANGYITVKSEVPGGAKIVTSSTYGVHIQGDYVKLDGFDISGAKSSGVTAHKVDHVKITNNIVHGNGDHGISASLSDYITIDGNTTYGNAKNGFYSGISVYHPVAVANDGSGSAYRIIVSNNVSYDNVTKSGPHTDGNGIILDDFRTTKDASLPAYTNKTLVENNLVYENGGKGIQVAWSDYVTVRNNTAWHNNQDNQNSGTWRGELSNMNSSHNTWVNNIAVADLNTNKSNRAVDNTSYTGYSNSDNVWKNNLTYSGVSGDESVRKNGGNSGLSESNGNLLGVDPKLTNPYDNFDPKVTSPVVDAGTKSYGYSATDHDGVARSGAVDIGAFEVSAAIKAAAGLSTSDSAEAESVATESVQVPVTGKTLQGGSGNNALVGTSGADKIYGGAGLDTLTGNAGADKLYGEAGADKLLGGSGDDLLQGGTGHDVLTGGAGADDFVFRTVAEAGKGSDADDIIDFSRSQGDKIDLSGIDANIKASGDQAFSYIGSKDFTGKAGQLKYSDGHLTGDINGDKIADFQIDLNNHHSLVASDFLL